MAKLGTILQVVPADIFTSSSVQQAPLGAYAETPDGRGFRYVQNGATTMVPGNIYQSAAEITNHQNRPADALAVGDTSIKLDLGATAVEADEYAGGFLCVSANAGEGQMYGIAGHTAVATSSSLTVTLSEPVQVATTTASKYDLVKNPYRHVVVNPATATGAPVGVALHGVTASEYGWVQTHGPCNTRAKGALTVGLNLIVSSAQAGAVGTDESDVKRVPIVGHCLTGVADSEFGVTYLTID